MLAPIMMAMIASAPMLAVFAAQMTPTTVAAPYPAAIAQSRARRRRHAIAADGTQVSRLSGHSGLAPSAITAAHCQALLPRLAEPTTAAPDWQLPVRVVVLMARVRDLAGRRCWWCCSWPGRRPCPRVLSSPLLAATGRV